MNALGLAESDLRGLVDDIWSSLFDPPPMEADDLTRSGETVIGYVDISGGWEGRVLVSTTPEGAVAIAARLLDLPAERVELADLADAIGELANIVGGSVKSCVVGHSTLSLPNITVVDTARDPDALEVAALWNDHPLRVRVTTARPTPLIPSARHSAQGEPA